MALTQRIEVRQGQPLIMTPQLQQAIKLLELSNLELSAYVEQQMEANPLIERDDDANPDGGSETIPDSEPLSEPAIPLDSAAAASGAADALNPPISELGDDNLWQSDVGGITGERFGKGGRSDFGCDERGIEESLRQPIGLRDHLLTQMRLDLPDPTERAIGMLLIDMLDEAGYLRGDPRAVAERLGCATVAVEAVLAKLQQFEPAGLFARSLAECLALQLRDRNRLDPAMQTLLDHLDLLASHDRGRLMQLCGVDAEDLYAMIAEIRALDPKPALAFEAWEASPAVPDILMHRRHDGGWQLELNPATLPRVLINRTYVSQIAGLGANREARDFLSERLAAANWLVKSLHQRATTILKVATEIVRQQEAFFQHGVQHLRPLIRRDIASAIGMHESTVCRVTSNKWIASPRGLFELRYFFGASIGGAGGEQHAAEAVRLRIRQLIEREPPSATLSDDQLVALLQHDHIEIARRTVAKYRESMRIPSSVQRRRNKSHPAPFTPAPAPARFGLNR